MYSLKMNRIFSLSLLLGFSCINSVIFAANDNLNASNVSAERQVENDFTQDFISIFNSSIENLNMTQKGITVRFTVSHPSFGKEASFELNKSEIDSFNVLKLLSSTILRNLIDENLVCNEKAENTIFGYPIKEVSNIWKSSSDNVISQEIDAKLSEIVNSLSEKVVSDFENNLLNFQKNKSKGSKIEGMKMSLNIKNDKENVEVMKQRKLRNSKA